jgi:hypothetical protein
MKFEPKFDEFIHAEEEILKAKLVGIRATIIHPGEKGRSVEYQVMELLRSFLPNEYGLSTGFIVYHKSDCIEFSEKDEPHYKSENDKILISGQLDIIIYDALRCGPIVRLGSCDIFTLESIYGYVEVKTELTNIHSKDEPPPIQKCLQQSDKLRDMRQRFYWEPVRDTFTGMELCVVPNFTSIRSYLFALGASDDLGDSNNLKAIFEKESKQVGGFFSGIYIQGKGFYKSHHCEKADDPLRGTFELLSKDNSLLKFKSELFSGLSRFPRVGKHLTPAIDTYIDELKTPTKFLKLGPYR